MSGTPMSDLIRTLWPILATALWIAMALAASVHAILTKREVRAAIGWAGLAWLSPYVGAILYAVLGINRIKRRAQSLRPRPQLPEETRTAVMTQVRAAVQSLGYDPDLVRLAGAISGEELTVGNHIEALVSGDAAYPLMLEAIGGAERSIGLCSYIFDHDRAGVRFIHALETAHRRGVEVRVLIDGVGARYSKPRTPKVLRELGVPVAEFLSGLVTVRMPYMNLRNHRKILTVDGQIAFTGGMNIREGCVLELDCHHPVQDLHFRLTGPVVEQIQEVFTRDWSFTTGEVLSGDAWFPELGPTGECAARSVPDGPDDDFEKIYETFLAAINNARESIRIASPYFLPDEALARALQLAAKAGKRVEIILPEVNNLRLVQWAMTAELEHVFVPGISVWLTPPPFDHTKLMIVDGLWVSFGSANWDSRSLRLNFEMNVNSMNAPLAERLDALLDDKIASARRLEPEELKSRRLPVRLRDGAVRLFSPYL
jgi:cardiolipin synthase